MSIGQEIVKFESVLKHIGASAVHEIQVVLPFIVKIAQVAAPIVSAGDPALGALIQTGIGVILSTEKSFAGVTGSGTQKMAQVIAILTPVFENTFTQLGFSKDPTRVTAWSQVLVDVLNSIPAAELQSMIQAALPAAK